MKIKKISRILPNCETVKNKRILKHTSPYSQKETIQKFAFDQLHSSQQMVMMMMMMMMMTMMKIRAMKINGQRPFLLKKKKGYHNYLHFSDI